VRGRGAAVKYLSHNASFHSKEKIAPSNRGIKQQEKKQVSGKFNELSGGAREIFSAIGFLFNFGCNTIGLQLAPDAHDEGMAVEFEGRQYFLLPLKEENNWMLMPYLIRVTGINGNTISTPFLIVYICTCHLNL
jgi:hypothetical protein